MLALKKRIPMIMIELWGKPIVLKRPRFNSLTKSAYDSQSESREHMQWQMKMQWPNEPLKGPLTVGFQFFFLPPKNTSFVKKKQMYNNIIKCITKGDLSNFVKWAEDCGNNILWEDDRQIWRYGDTTGRYWGEKEKTIITIHEE